MKEGNLPFLWRILLVAVVLPFVLANGRTQTITNIITIPLYSTNTDTGANKWGIYASLAGSDTPQLFEFDTGAGGFYATYSSTNTNSLWWGTNTITPIRSNTEMSYDSGYHYTGNTVETSVSLFADSNGSSAQLNMGSVVVGQVTGIDNTKKPNDPVYWSNAPVSNPPIDNAFYGDFGMGLRYGSNGLVNLIEQLQFSNGITPGFIVNTPLNGQNGFLQIGLSSTDTNNSGFNYFTMNLDTNTTNITASGTPYYSETQVNMTMSVSNSATGSNYTTNIAIVTDTGATPEIHNPQSASNPSFPTNWIVQDASSNTLLSNSLTVSLSATNTRGQLTNIYTIGTSNRDDYSNSLGKVSVQETNSNTTNTEFFLNAGLYFFDNQQVSYDLSNGVIGVGALAVPEPSPYTLLGFGTALLAAIVAFRKFIAHRPRPPR